MYPTLSTIWCRQTLPDTAANPPINPQPISIGTCLAHAGAIIGDRPRYFHLCRQ
jgi:hypothetical protein